MSAGATVVMAKAPRPGYAKTRLEPLLGAEGCARLQAALLRQTVAVAAAAGGAVEVHHAPAGAAAELAPLLPTAATLFPQSGGDLGARMAAAVAGAHVRHGGPVLVVGTDMPTLSPGHLGAAHQALAAGADVCFGPARDGGYYLAGLARPGSAVFALPAAAWGGPDVLELSVEAAQASGMTIVLLGTEGDLDTPADARRARADRAVPPPVRALLAGEGA